MAEAGQQQNGVFSIEKIYLKDVSYEAPGLSSAIIQTESAAAEIGVQLGLEHNALNSEQGVYEVALTVTAIAKSENKNIFLVEVKQAGIFRITGMKDEMLVRTLEVSCATILLPFVREAINDLVCKGGFPQLMISPINFVKIYEQKQTT
ncbi:MAG: protein-export chaperone SecB [Sulfuricaulis sp.]